MSFQSGPEVREPDAGEQLARSLSFARRVFRFWPTVLVTLLVGALGATAFLLIVKPQYRSETVVLYSEGVNRTSGSEPTTNTRNVAVRLKEILMARPKLERVVREFDLYPDVRRRFGNVDAVDELKKHIDFRSPGGDTFSIAFIGRSPTEAQAVTRRLAEMVLEGDSELRKKQSGLARDFLKTEKDTTENDLGKAEQELAAFLAKHPRFALDQTPLATGAAIRATLAPTTPFQGGVAAQMLARGGAMGSPRAAAELFVPAPPPPRPEDTAAMTALANARATLAERMARYTPAHPDVRSAQAEVARAEARVKELAASRPAVPVAAVAPTSAAPIIKRSVVAPPPAAPAAPAANNLTKPAELVELETEWFRLTRAVTEARQRQAQVEAALFKADMWASSEGGGHGVQVQVIDPAFLPQRALPPGRTTIVAIFLGLALALGMMIAMVRALLDDRIYGARDAESITTLIVEVPRMSSNRRAHVAG
jgi:uncharacterized protein involved in exopolysaccharide biosynthesis